MIFLNLYEDLNTQKDTEDILIKTITIMDNLIESPGYPSNWNSTNVERIGLCYDRAKIDPYKLSEFMSINESTVYNSLNTGKYKVNINLQYPNGTIFRILDNETKVGTIFPEDTSDLKNVLYLREYVVYQNEKLILEVRLWD